MSNLAPPQSSGRERRADAVTAPASDRFEKRRRALAVLEQCGLAGSEANAPAFRALAKEGIVVKPLVFWSFPGLFIFAFLLLTTFLGGPVMLWVASGIPLIGAASAIADAGPLPFLAVNAALAVAFAALFRIRARRLGLPAWKDL
jgi:hypothetical protein